MIILLTKTTIWCEYAARLAKIVFGDELIWISGNVGDPLPDIPDGDIISFLCPWVLPASVLEGRQAINFHPGSSNYPGAGYNFALFEDSKEYGVTCHHMLPVCDSGDIIEEVLFPIYEGDTIENLQFRSMVHMLALFDRIIANYDNLPVSGVKWKRPQFTKKQLHQLNKDYPNTRCTRYPDA